MPTQNNIKTLRIILPKVIHNISILYQNGEISTQEKDALCTLAKTALTTNNTDELTKRLNSLRFGTLFPDIVDECIQLVAN